VRASKPKVIEAIKEVQTVQERASRYKNSSNADCGIKANPDQHADAARGWMEKTEQPTVPISSGGSGELNRNTRKRFFLYTKPFRKANPTNQQVASCYHCIAYTFEHCLKKVLNNFSQRKGVLMFNPVTITDDLAILIEWRL